MKTRGSLPKVYEIFGSEMPLVMNYHLRVLYEATLFSFWYNDYYCTVCMTRGEHYIYFGYGDVPSGRVSIFQILV